MREEGKKGGEKEKKGREGEREGRKEGWEWKRECTQPLALCPGSTSQTIQKAGGEPGTSWHVTDIKLRQVDKTVCWHSGCET